MNNFYEQKIIDKLNSIFPPKRKIETLFFGNFPKEFIKNRKISCKKIKELQKFNENTFQEIAAINFFEKSDELPCLLEKLWEILEPECNIIIIINNKILPAYFSINQIKKALEARLFEVKNIERAIFEPPIKNYKIRKLAEFLIKNICPFFGKITIITAKKRIWKASTGEKLTIDTAGTYIIVPN